jgi:hypothetical protein
VEGRWSLGRRRAAVCAAAAQQLGAHNLCARPRAAEARCCRGQLVSQVEYRRVRGLPRRAPWRGQSGPACAAPRFARAAAARARPLFRPPRRPPPQGFPWDEATSSSAALGGHLEVLQWLHQLGLPLGQATCGLAARCGNLEMLQWAREQGCPWGGGTCSQAAGNGHLEVLQWAHQQGCPWDKDAGKEAAYFGGLEVLQWAHEQGHALDIDACVRMAGYGRRGAVLACCTPCSRRAAAAAGL